VANRFWVGGTGSWSDTAHWGTTSGGAGGQTVPGSGDVVTVDNHASGLNGGTLTVDQTVNVTSITAGSANGTINFGSNNVTTSASPGVSFGGSVTRNIDMGSGTWTFNGTVGSAFAVGTTTGLTLTSSSANMVFNGSSTFRSADFGTSQTYASLTIGSNSSKGVFSATSNTAVTFGSVTAASGNTLSCTQSASFTVTGALTMTGTSSAPVGLFSGALNVGNVTVSVGSASTIDWGSILRVTKSGAGSITATNSFDLGGNTSFASITAPSGGGGGGQRVIG